MDDEVPRRVAKRTASREPERLTSESPVRSASPYWRSEYDTASRPPRVESAHWKHWLGRGGPRACVTGGSPRGSGRPPVKGAPPSRDTLTRMSLLQAPGVR